MLQIESTINLYLTYIIIGLVGMILIILCMLVINMFKLKKIQKKYKSFMLKEDVDIEEILIHYVNRVKKIEDDYKLLMNATKDIEVKMKGCIQKVGVVRYNGIEHVGGDLSFAIAILDEYNNGVVLNGIYSRDGSYTYAKPIEDLKSKYKLSEEEQEALNKALKI